MIHAAHIAANRFGLGARPGDLATIGSDGPDWLETQLRAPPETPDASLPGAAAGLATFFERLTRQRQAGSGKQAAAPRPDGELLRRYIDEVAAREKLAIATAAPLRERLVRFWSNHFTVSIRKGPLIAAAGAFEREAIRPHVTGSFAEMLLAVARHPAMLLYLDNAQSFGPNSRGGRRRGRGINENLAREILELHTVGVDGGYQQDDVTELARALTGWTVSRGQPFAPPAGRFFYVDVLHEPGSRRVLGRRYRDSGAGQAEAVLRDLAGLPATARFLATKLARHFVADEPPSGLVERLARRYLDSDGDLAAMTMALIAAPEAWQPDPVKLKTPGEFIVSALRALALPPLPGRRLAGMHEALGQPVFAAPSPAGWPDVASAWASPDGISKRLDLAAALSRAAPRRAPLSMARDVLGAALSAPTAQAMQRAGADREALTLLLMSPEFQRR